MFRIIWLYVILWGVSSGAVQCAEVDFKQIQVDLNRLGYNVGTADGIPGRRTKIGLQSFFNDAGYVAPANIGEAEQTYIHDLATFASKPLDLMQRVITRVQPIGQLSNDELCELHKNIDLIDSFNEVKNRGLSCPSGTERPIKYAGELLNDPIKLLNEFKQKFAIQVPKFNLAETRTFASWDKTKTTYHFLNADLQNELNDRSRVIEYCAEWMPNIGSVPPDPSKNLDGTGSWAENTMRDGFVVCQDHVNKLYLGTLSGDESLAQRRLDQFKHIVETWVNYDKAHNFPFRPYHKMHNAVAGRADPNFTFLMTISKAMAGVELLNDALGWDEAQWKRYGAWAKDRVLQRLPVGGRSDPLPNGVCLLKVNKSTMNDACMNAAPFLAHGLLRAAIAAQDQHLAELSYLVFKQYSSAIAPDGSQAYDRIRDCYAADYTIWAAQFLHDYVYLASTLGVDLWTDRFSPKHGSPLQNIEYALRVMDDSNVVNEYAQDFGFPDCIVKNGQLQQNERRDPISTFAYYFYSFDRDRLDDIYQEKRNGLWSYTSTSGVNYEVDIVMNDAALSTHFIQNKDRIFAQRAEKDALKRQKEREALLNARGFRPITGDDPVAGRYAATWYFVNAARPNSPRERQAVDVLVLKGGTGQFEGAQTYNQPSAKLRRDLFVAYKENGDIFVSGELDLFDRGRSYPTELNGTLTIGDGPEIQGVWDEGDIYEIELQKIE